MDNFKKYIGLMESKELAAEGYARLQNWNSSLLSNGLGQRIIRNFKLFNNADPTSANVFGSYDGDFGVYGENSEMLSLRISHFRNLLWHMFNIVFNKLPVPAAQASKSTLSALQGVDVANALLANLWQPNKLQKHVKKAGLYSLVSGTGPLVVDWDTNIGDVYMTDANSGDKFFNGDVRLRSIGIDDFTTDPGVTEFEDSPWVVYREPVNKYLRAAQFPDLEKEILAIPNDFYLRTIPNYDTNQTDMIYEYTFVHKACNGVLNNGRICKFLSPDIVLHDGPNVYDGINLFLIKPQENLGSIYGSSPSFDIAPIQMFYDTICTAMATTIAHGAIPNIVMRKGSGLSVNNLIGGYNVWEIAPGIEAPTAVDLLNLKPELVNMLPMLEQIAQTISGVDGVTRGNMDSSKMSGVAMDISQSMTVQYISGYQNSVIQTMMDISRFAMRFYRKFTTGERIVSIIGDNKSKEAMTWKSESLNGIDDVYYDAIDPLSQTIAGKKAMAKELIDAGQVNPQQYISVATRGTLEPETQKPMKERDYIQEENQALMRGERAYAVFSDNHALHFDEHSGQTFDVKLRAFKDQPGTPEYNILSNILQHMQEHMAFMQGAPPYNQNADNMDAPPPQEQVIEQVQPTNQPQQQLQG